MILHRRRHGSQRGMAPLKVEMVPNITGDCQLTVKGADGVYYTLEPETDTEVRALMSEAHVIHHNWKI